MCNNFVQLGFIRKSLSPGHELQDNIDFAKSYKFAVVETTCLNGAL